MPKKKAKKKAKKTVKRKKRKARRKQPETIFPPNYHLHQAKLNIMKAVPIMPCSAISKDVHGLKFAHTQAEKVYQVYREKCQEYGLVIRRIKGNTTNGIRPEKYWDMEKERFIWSGVPCVRFEGVWEIEHIDSGERETFGGSGDGDNFAWAANSAQTKAKKQALLDYFETAWPQPSNWLEVVRKAIEDMPEQERMDVIQMIVPSNIIKATGVLDELGNYYDSVFQKGQKNAKRTRKTKH